eukprot:7945890-Prorocentrum_lima.AAC.1
MRGRKHATRARHGFRRGGPRRLRPAALHRRPVCTTLPGETATAPTMGPRVAAIDPSPWP